MLYIITSDGCAWISAATIVGVQRGIAENAIVKLHDGEAIVSLERYESFVERLNTAWLKAAGVERTWEPQEVDSRTKTAPAFVLSSHEEETVFGRNLGPVFP